MNDGALDDQVNKRLTLNWLIQGAAQHAGMTLHHLVRDDLNELNPRLVRLYDQYALMNLLQYWSVDAAILLGWPPLFWKRAQTSRRHPFFNHPLLPRYGGILAAASRARAMERCEGKGLPRSSLVRSILGGWIEFRLKRIEAPHRPRLVSLAKASASAVWGIPVEKLDAEIGQLAPFGTPIRAQSVSERMLRAATVGLGGVARQGDSLKVMGRGVNWYLAAKELVKGSAELICMHGLTDLNDEEYRLVVDRADRLAYEPWMLQTGGELWRRLLAVAPQHFPIAELLMHMARLPPEPLHALLVSVIEQTDLAREVMASLGGEPSAW